MGGGNLVGESCGGARTAPQHGFACLYASPLARWSTDASTSVEMLDRAPFPARTPPPPPDKPPPRPQHSSFLLQRAASASSLHPARASHRATLKPPEPDLWSKEPPTTGTTEGYGWAEQLSEQERALKSILPIVATAAHWHPALVARLVTALERSLIRPMNERSLPERLPLRRLSRLRDLQQDGNMPDPHYHFRLESAVIQLRQELRDARAASVQLNKDHAELTEEHRRTSADLEETRNRLNDAHAAHAVELACIKDVYSSTLADRDGAHAEVERLNDEGRRAELSRMEKWNLAQLDEQRMHHESELTLRNEKLEKAQARMAISGALHRVKVRRAKRAADGQRENALAAADASRVLELESAEKRHASDLKRAAEEHHAMMTAEKYRHAAEVEALEARRVSELAALDRRREVEVKEANDRRLRQLEAAEHRRVSDVAAVEAKRRLEVEEKEVARNASVEATIEWHATQLEQSERRRKAEMTKANEKHRLELEQPSWRGCGRTTDRSRRRWLCKQGGG